MLQKSTRKTSKSKVADNEKQYKSKMKQLKKHNKNEENKAENKLVTTREKVMHKIVSKTTTN